MQLQRDIDDGGGGGGGGGGQLSCSERSVPRSTPRIQPRRVRGLPAPPVAGAVRARGSHRLRAAAAAAAPLLGGDRRDDEAAADDHQDDDARAADSPGLDGDHDYQDTDARQRHGEDRGEPVGLQKTSGTAHSLSCLKKIETFVHNATCNYYTEGVSTCGLDDPDIENTESGIKRIIQPFPITRI